MCGIIAGISKKNILPILEYGLEKLEYRGYDSAGIAILINEKICSVKSVGKITKLKERLAEKILDSKIGIGHTRWATHGAVTLESAHPHVTDNVAIVHNGIIENYSILKTELENKHYSFTSKTDSEVISKLLDYYISCGMTPEDASNRTIDRLEGAFSVIFMFKGEKNLLFIAKDKVSLMIGSSNNGTYIASDILAFNDTINSIVYLEDKDRAIINLDSYQIFTKNRKPTIRNKVNASISQQISKSGYPHFMLKEIYEQPKILHNTLNEYLFTSRLADLLSSLENFRSIKILACGSAYYAGFIAKYWLEELANIPVDLEIASEYIYRKSPHKQDVLAIIISQSGETLDTFEALKKAKSLGHTILSIVNVEQSAIAKASDYVLPIMAGAEIGVASTKAFLAQITVLASISIYIGYKSKNIDEDTFKQLRFALLETPNMIEQILSTSDNIKNIATEMKDFNNALFIGRGFSYPIALEGALKLKELSYIHSEAYAGGELKHGPISLIDNSMPVIALLPSGRDFNKIFSNVQEVVARGARALCIIDKNNIDKISSHIEWYLEVPSLSVTFSNYFISPIIYTVPLQLLAYYIADLKGNDVDQPRNLAKSITVE